MNKIVKYSITLASLAILGGVSPLSTQLVGTETIVYANNPTQTETRKIALVYKDSEKAEYIGEGSSIDLKPGETYTFTAPELAGYEFVSLDYADASYWTEGVIVNGTKEQHYRSNVGTLTLSYDDIAPVIEADRTFIPALYVNYKEVVATNPSSSDKTGETLPTNTNNSQQNSQGNGTTTDSSTASSQNKDMKTSSSTANSTSQLVLPSAKETTEKKTLPKTGQEYSYLPLLGIAGLGLIASTYLLRRKSN